MGSGCRAVFAVSLFLHYLPCEFSNVLVVVTYIPPSANANLAKDRMTRVVHDLQSGSPDALVIINGDFNHGTLSSSLPSFRQFVACSTRSNKTFDLFYANVKDSHSSVAPAQIHPLGL